MKHNYVKAVDTHGNEHEVVTISKDVANKLTIEPLRSIAIKLADDLEALEKQNGGRKPVAGPLGDAYRLRSEEGLSQMIRAGLTDEEAQAVLIISQGAPLWGMN